MQVQYFISGTNLDSDSTDAKQASHPALEAKRITSMNRLLLGPVVSPGPRNAEPMSRTLISTLERIARSIQPYPHGGINE